jgi:hypothetical protein
MTEPHNLVPALRAATAILSALFGMLLVQCVVPWAAWRLHLTVAGLALAILFLLRATRGAAQLVLFHEHLARNLHAIKLPPGTVGVRIEVQAVPGKEPVPERSLN